MSLQVDLSHATCQVGMNMDGMERSALTTYMFNMPVNEVIEEQVIQDTLSCFASMSAEVLCRLLSWEMRA